jgi:hypothetical protein
MRLMGVIRWLPWRWLLRRAARSQGFLDPLALMARLRRFGQPSEVAEPIELLRAGMVFHARGLINTRVIQHNLDWVWPYWIEQQFDPYSSAFLPRAFSITHVNLTHRNWTAVGRPDCAALPIVDPRGLVTAMEDGWSLDGWILGADGTALYPSRAKTAKQSLTNEPDDLRLTTQTAQSGMTLETRAQVWRESGPTASSHVLVCDYEAESATGGQLAIALRPYNPEGISFIQRVQCLADETGRAGGWRWQVQDDEPGSAVTDVHFDTQPDAFASSDYVGGDAALKAASGDAPAPVSGASTDCDTGLVTAVALYNLGPGEARTIRLRIPLPAAATQPDAVGWASALAGAAQLQVPDARFQHLYDTALRTLLLHSVEDIYPGPYTYRRFWFRDAAFIIHALLHAGFADRAEQALARFPERQTRATGYFHSQEGEWDANGQALWILARFHALTGRLPAGVSQAEWLRVIRRGAHWIERKRLPADDAVPEAGLLPAGFSAEHLGPNDYYYWDDDWAVGGLRAAAVTVDAAGDPQLADWMRAQADDLAASLTRAHDADVTRLGRTAIPASPRRRMDAGAIGSIAIGYPLQSVAADDPRLLGTVEYLLAAHRVHGGFFQEMIHSGVNAYLTLHLAQVLLRAGDARGLELMDAVAALASPTGQWPEAIHPGTYGGCMGDGQHVWAAAEWVAMMRHAFVREENEGLVLGAGLQTRWLQAGEVLGFGPTPTPHGAVRVTVHPDARGAHRVEWAIDGPDPDWVRIALPGRQPLEMTGALRTAQLPESTP